MVRVSLGDNISFYYQIPADGQTTKEKMGGHGCETGRHMEY